MSDTLKRLIDAWRGRDLLSEMLDEFQQMLTDGEWMFQTVSSVLQRQQKPESVHDDFFARDKVINNREREIRRRIVEHLNLRPEADISSGLVLMSVVKDAERIGDYCKDIYEVACLCTISLEGDAYVNELNERREALAGMFAKVRAAFAEADQQRAVDLVLEAREVRNRCDDMLPKLMNDNLPTQKTVAYVLISRYYKRIAAHLANICTSVTGPVYEMDHSLGAEERMRKTYGKKP